MSIEVISHRIEVIQAKDEAVAKALETIGLVAERYAKELCPTDTSRLKNSISHQVDDETVTEETFMPTDEVLNTETTST